MATDKPTLTPSATLTTEDVAAELYFIFGNITSEITDNNIFDTYYVPIIWNPSIQ